MTILEFAELVKSMRDAQRTYFRHRNQTDLENSKALEREVDHVIACMLKPPQPTLFDCTITRGA